MKSYVYRTQRSRDKVMFPVSCVKNSVHGGSTWAGTTWQVHPQAGTPSLAGTPSSRYTSWQVPPGQVHTPGRYTHQQVHPLAGTHTPPRAGTPLRELCMLGDTGNKRAVRILLECILVLCCYAVIDFTDVQWSPNWQVSVPVREPWWPICHLYYKTFNLWFGWWNSVSVDQNHFLWLSWHWCHQFYGFEYGRLLRSMQLNRYEVSILMACCIVAGC